ncbi:MAG: hypothetical protein GY943_33530, partial [Chloroflexi bacterium]|nr:hypothetical protein [Chloroflexota bacterium]
SPSAEVTADNFSASWIRTIDFSVGTYRFYMFSDDGIRAYINNELIVDEWHDADGFAYYIDITIFAAGSAEFRIEYYENLGDARIEVWWEEIDGFENWRGEYWNNTTLSGSSALVRNDTAINYSWGSDSPAAEINADDFSVRWTRRLSFSEGTYTFRATIDDGMRVYIDDTLVLDEWSANSNRTVTFDVLLTSGEHDIWVEYYELTGEAIAVLTWEQTSGSSTWVGEYWSNADFSGAPAYTVAADEIDFDWRQGSPISGLPADNFSVRWTGQFSFEDGRYTFTARADDGVRVYIDGVLLIDAWNDGSDKAVTADVDLNGLHTILVEYYDVAVSAHVLVSYTKN